MDERTVGVIGGGQLGRMMAEAGHRLGVRLAVLDAAGIGSPAGQVAELSVEGGLTDEEKIRELASVSDVLTVEIEHVNAAALEHLEAEGHVVRPNAATISLIQDKYLQKQHFAAHAVPLPEFLDVPSLQAAKEAGLRFGYPYMLKNKKLAYDGRGNAVVSSEAGIVAAIEKLCGGRRGSAIMPGQLYAEKWVPFIKELAVMVVRTASSVMAYPVVETIQRDSICHVVIAPARISQRAADNASSIVESAIASLPGIGIYGVELFLLPDDGIVLNEVAPRPHNSGHYTMEACDVDQFEMHLRAVLDLPVPKPSMKVGCAIMVNILGEATMQETKAMLFKAMGSPGAGVHWYGKNETRVGRKMAHFTITADDWDTLRLRCEAIGLPASVHDLGAAGSNAPTVGVIMGSDSDLPTMKEACEVLEKFGVSYEVTIVSAHRTPTRMFTYAQSAAERGVKVIIAGAGGAAHLPGMVASLTPLPVIGVPIKTSILSGNDSLLSIVQMPKGVPVATVAIGNAANAGLLALRILGTRDASLRRAMEAFLSEQEEEVLGKAARLETLGYSAYLAGAGSK